MAKKKTSSAENRQATQNFRDFIDKASVDELVEGLVECDSKNLTKIWKAIAQTYETVLSKKI